jgi:hypothetical protein
MKYAEHGYIAPEIRLRRISDVGGGSIQIKKLRNRNDNAAFRTLLNVLEKWWS